jgi:photosystem II stability/assembly factor-like uncharacterized protein
MQHKFSRWCIAFSVCAFLLTIAAFAFTTPVAFAQDEDVPRVSAIATSKLVTDSILLAFELNPVPVFTTNGGETWHRVATTPWATVHVSSTPSVGLAPRAEPGILHRMIVGIGQNRDLEPGMLYRSGDNGQSWAEETLATVDCSAETFSNPVALPDDPAHLYLLHTCIIYVPLGGEVYHTAIFESVNAGVTWQKVPEENGGFPPAQYIISLLASPTVADRLYAHEAGGTWLIRDSGSDTWEETVFPVWGLALDAQDAQWLYGITARFVTTEPEPVGMRSEDGGVTWDEWAEQPCPFEGYPGEDEGNVQIMAHPTISKNILVRCAAGLYRSTNGGDEWTQLANVPGQLLAPDYGVSGRILWAKNDGLWASTDSGDNWEAIMPDFTLTDPSQLVSTYLPSILAND